MHNHTYSSEKMLQPDLLSSGCSSWQREHLHVGFCTGNFFREFWNGFVGEILFPLPVCVQQAYDCATPGFHPNTVASSGDKLELTVQQKCNRIKCGVQRDDPGLHPAPVWWAHAAPSLLLALAPSVAMDWSEGPSEPHSAQPCSSHGPSLPRPKEVTYILPGRQGSYYKSRNINYTFIFLWFFFLLLQFSFQYKLSCQKDISDVSNSPL